MAVEGKQDVDGSTSPPWKGSSDTELALPVECPAGINERSLVRKIDFRVLPILFIIYVAAFLDRVNISNALTLGLPKDLHLTGQQPNVALTIFFVPYVLFEIPSNIVLRKLKPHVWLSACMGAFGIIMLCQGFVHNYSGILATRFFLGLAEAGVFPGSFYLISHWYKREESQRRFTVYWCSVLLATMFGGLLATAISNMHNVRGYHSWSWIFILEGIVTVLLSILAFFTIPDFPEDAKWLTAEERDYVIARTQVDNAGTDGIKLKDLFWFFTDVKNLLGGLIYFAIVIPIYAFAYFAPTIIRTLKYSIVETQLHTVPPVAAALGLCILFAWASDRYNLRSPFLAFCIALTIAGLGILLTVHHNFHVQYAAICLVTMGAFSGGPIVVCWYVMNLRGHRDRSIGTAWMIGFGNTGGIVATFSFLTKDAPEYRLGYAICMGATCIAAVSVALYAALCMWENRRERNRGVKKLSL